MHDVAQYRMLVLKASQRLRIGLKYGSSTPSGETLMACVLSAERLLRLAIEAYDREHVLELARRAAR